MAIASGMKISMEYTLTLDTGEVVDTNVGSDPLNFVHGDNQIIPGLESGIVGLNVGDSKEVSVEPEDAYGPVINDAIVKFKKEQLSEEICKIGAQVQTTGPQGQVFQGRVIEIIENEALIDFNHPLAGKKLNFNVKIIDVQ